MSTTSLCDSSPFPQEVLISVMGISLWGRLFFPEAPKGMVLQVHYNTPEDSWLDAMLPEVQRSGFAVFTINLSCFNDHPQAELSRNIPVLTERLLACLAWVSYQPLFQDLPCVLVALEHGAVPAAIRAAVQRDAQVRALVCLRGLPDQAGGFYLDNLQCPTLIVTDVWREGKISIIPRLCEQVVTKIALTDGLAGDITTVKSIGQWLCTHMG